MQEGFRNFAFIDGANLRKGADDLDWHLDYQKFRIWLEEKHKVIRAYIFLGLVPKYKDLYTYLQEIGYTLVFKETTLNADGKIKGNCDADLVLMAVRETYEETFDKAILVSSDGDYASLVKFMQEKDKLRMIVSPSNRCSILLKRTNAPITHLDELSSLLERAEDNK